MNTVDSNVKSDTERDTKCTYKFHIWYTALKNIILGTKWNLHLNDRHYANK